MFVWQIILSASLGAQPDFRASVWPVIEKAQCRGCHNDNGVASTTRLQFPADSADPAEIGNFGLRLRALVDSSQPARSLLLLKPTNRVSHGGGERIRQDSADERALEAWVRYLATLPASVAATRSGPRGPSKPVLRRLTHSQYNHTVRDLLKEETRPADQFPKEDFVNGYTNQAEGQSVSPLQAEAYSRAAERIARNAFGKGDRRGLIACMPSEECRAEFLRALGRRAYRRPLSDTEVAKFVKLAGREPDFVKGIQMAVETMLQSPNFLFHVEPGAYAIASRLSYFLWDTMPDDALLNAVTAGELDSAQGVERHARRMLADPRARAALDEFLNQWMRFDRLRNALKDRRVFPEYAPELAANMIEETARLFRHLVWNNADFMDFYRAGYSFLVPDLARLYDLPSPPEPWGRVEYPKGYQRAGILGQASFLALASKPADTSPTERGLFIREHFLCQQVPPPPAGVSTTLAAVTDEKPTTQRQRLQEHLSNAVCAGCHQLVDPIGFGFEKFDAIGKLRSEELVIIHPTADDMKTRRKLKPTEYRLPIDARGFVRGLSNSEFSTPRELGTILANEPACQRCVVKQIFRYAVGRMEQSEDAPVLDAAFDRFRRSQFRFQDLIIAIASSDPFRGGL